MKILLLIYLLMGSQLVLGQAHIHENLQRRRGELIPPQIVDINRMNSVLLGELKQQKNDLTKIKYYLINGETRLAKTHLLRLAYTRTKLRPVIYRYLATLSFIESDFHKTYEYLSLPELQQIPYYGNICVLKVLSQIVLNKTRTLDNEWDKCRIENATSFRSDKLPWLQTLVQLKLKPLEGITKVPFEKMKLAALNIEETKTMMKLALYLNQEELLAGQIPFLEVEQLQDPEIREIAGQALFRIGSLAKAYKFVEDLKSPNAENIKGNLYLLRNKYELAYAQFKLALEQKLNSQNAMERLLPLAWLLSDWEGGSKYAEQVIASPQTQINKLTIMAAFLMQKGDYERSNIILQSIATKSRRGTEIEVTQLAAFTALMQNKPDIIKKQATMSCNQYDMLSCWMLFQLTQWDAFPLTIRREDKVPVKREWENLTKSTINNPLNETVFVNQLDIEELDDKLIQLTPGS
ncbi:MAG: tetratricopeptide repeat protein [Bacteriovoracia bacterium]